MADYKKYLEKKTAGTADLIKINGGYALSFKRFSQDTGEAIKPEVQAISRNEMEEVKTNLQEEIAGIDEIIADMDALDAAE